MDLVAVEGDEKASSHSADDSHQHYAKGEGIDDRPAPRRVEVILGKERRRRWSADEKAETTAASFVPGANISAVARQYGVSQGLLHYWRRCVDIAWALPAVALETVTRGYEHGGSSVKAPKRAKLLTLDQLETWFDKTEPAPPCRGVSTLNGFLTGLAAGPVFLLPNDWMFHVIGAHEEKAFVGNKIQAVVETIVDHYNLIAHQLTVPGRYAPMLMRTMMRKSCLAIGPTGSTAP